jgi:hypothetical protein
MIPIPAAGAPLLQFAAVDQFALAVLIQVVSAEKAMVEPNERSTTVARGSLFMMVFKINRWTIWVLKRCVRKCQYQFLHFGNISTEFVLIMHESREPKAKASVPEDPDAATGQFVPNIATCLRYWIH